MEGRDPMALAGAPDEPAASDVDHAYAAVEPGGDSDAIEADASVDSPAPELPSKPNDDAGEEDPESDPSTPAEETDPQRLALDKMAADNIDALEDGSYVIQSAVADDKVLDVNGGSDSDGANVQTYVSNMTAAQRWKVVHDEKGYVSFISGTSSEKKMLDVKYGNAANGANVQQYESNDSYAQKWILKRDGSGWRVFSALQPDLVLDVAGASSSNGANLQLYQANGTLAQLFFFLPTAPQVKSCERIIGEGNYTVASMADPGSVLDIAGAGRENGTNVQVYTSNGTTAQVFRFKYQDGYYGIQSSGTGKCLDVNLGNLVQGTNVQTWTPSSSNVNQLFSAQRNDDGSFSFISVANGLALTSGRGSNIETRAFDGGSHQRFTLTDVAHVLGDGLYEIVANISRDKRVDVAGGSTSAGAQVQIFQSNGTLAQKWNLSALEGEKDTYTLQSVASGMYLTHGSDGTITQQSRQESPGQRWVVDLSSGAFTLSPLSARNHRMDVKGGSSCNSTPVQGYQANGTEAQSFWFVRTAPLADGTYFVAFSEGDSQVLDVSGGSESNYANVQSYKRNDTAAQKWFITQQSDGSYLVRNAKSEKALDVNGGSDSVGANVQQYSSNGTNAQRWYLVYDGGAGTFRFVSALSSKNELGTSGRPASGANVQTVAAGTGASMTFEATSYDTNEGLSGEQRAMANRAQWYGSSTNWLLMVNATDNRVGVFNWSSAGWQLYDYFLCSSGAYYTPTVRGEFSVQGKGYAFGDSSYTCYYYTQFYGDYLLHSVLYDGGTFNIQDGRLGMHISHGCVRLDINKARWIYENVPYGTKVVVY